MQEYSAKDWVCNFMQKFSICIILGFLSCTNKSNALHGKPIYTIFRLFFLDLSCFMLIKYPTSSYYKVFVRKWRGLHKTITRSFLDFKKNWFQIKAQMLNRLLGICSTLVELLKIYNGDYWILSFCLILLNNLQHGFVFTYFLPYYSVLLLRI